jgi:hypothetical protein
MIGVASEERLLSIGEMQCQFALLIQQSFPKS